MNIIAAFIGLMILLIIIAVAYEIRRDREWQKKMRNPIYEETWRQVPPPNWASRRGTQDYW